MTRYRIEHEDGTPVTVDPLGCPIPTYGSMTEACLVLIFAFPDHPDLRPVPIPTDPPAPSPFAPHQPGIDS